MVDEAYHQRLARLEFLLAADDVPLLGTLPGLTAQGAAEAVTLTWHDGPDGALAARNLSLCRTDEHWRLERLSPAPETEWPASTPAPVLAEGAALDALDHPLPDDLAPVVVFEGWRSAFHMQSAPQQGDVQVSALHGMAAGRPIGRLWLTGRAPLLGPVAVSLAQVLRLGVPFASLALEAMQAARTGPLPARHLGPPVVRPEQDVSASLAHIVSHLLDTMLHWSTLAGIGNTPEPVHQMRVATRRLRSALSIYKHVAACPELAALVPMLKQCAAQLGAARDWDVFLGGTGADVSAAFPDSKPISAILRAGRRRRTSAYAGLRAYLASPAFRAMQVQGACCASLHPWEMAAMAGLHDEVPGFAGEVLDKRLRRVRKAGRGFKHLPATALHELRKDCKRLRYAAEFFASLFPAKPAKRFIRRLSRLQEELGLLNDATVAAGLMAQLGRTGQGFGGGVVEGFTAAAAGPARSRAAADWKRFRDAGRFWHG